MVRRRAVLIAGPTASGKSALALERAERDGGVIVCSDAMQVYDGLRVLTARPTPEDEARVSHLLFGAVDPAIAYDTGRWLRDVRAAIAAVPPERPLYFVGGTGLYFSALLDGIANIPPVPPEVVARLETEVATLDREGRGRLIAARDPRIAGRLSAPDPQRVIRALSVLEATGRSLADYQDEGQSGLLDGFSVERLVLAPDRALLRRRIAERFSGMLQSGAVDEVRALLARGLDPSLPAMKAIGVPQIAGWLRGSVAAAEAEILAVTATRQYAKRQETWFRNRMADWPRLAV